MDYMDLSVYDYIATLLDWGTDIFEPAYRQNKIEYHHFIYRQSKPSRTDTVKYLAILTNNFSPYICKAVIDDMKIIYNKYCKIIGEATRHIVRENIDIFPFDNVINRMPIETIKRDKLYPHSPDLKIITLNDSQIVSYWGENLDNSLFDYAVSLLEAHIGKAPAPENREPKPEQAFVLPPELNTPKARDYSHKVEDKNEFIRKISTAWERAINAGFIEQTSTGYKWASGIISECAYFADLCSEKFNLSKRADAANWKPFANIFGFTTGQFREAKSGWKNKGVFPARRKEIEFLFK